MSHQLRLRNRARTASPLSIEPHQDFDIIVLDIFDVEDTTRGAESAFTARLEGFGFGTGTESFDIEVNNTVRKTVTFTLAGGEIREERITFTVPDTDFVGLRMGSESMTFETTAPGGDTTDTTDDTTDEDSADIIVPKILVSDAVPGASAEIVATFEGFGFGTATETFDIRLDGRVIETLTVTRAGGEIREERIPFTVPDASSFTVEIGAASETFETVAPGEPAPGAPCGTNADCPGDQVCVKGECVPPPDEEPTEPAPPDRQARDGLGALLAGGGSTALLLIGGAAALGLALRQGGEEGPRPVSPVRPARRRRAPPPRPEGERR